MAKDYGVWELEEERKPLVGGHEPITTNHVIGFTGAETTYSAQRVMAETGGKLVAWDPDGEGDVVTPVTLLKEKVTVAADADAVCLIYLHGEFYRREMDWGAATDEQIATATKQLAAAGLFVK